MLPSCQLCRQFRRIASEKYGVAGTISRADLSLRHFEATRQRFPFAVTIANTTIEIGMQAIQVFSFVFTIETVGHEPVDIGGVRCWRLNTRDKGDWNAQHTIAH